MSQLRRLLLPAALVILVVATLAPNLSSAMPDRDSGVFLYTGSRLLQGETPYLDVWDHKGPLIYFVNAVGVLLDPGGERGIWLLEGAALLVSGWLCYRALRRTLGLWAAPAGAGGPFLRPGAGPP